MDKTVGQAHKVEKARDGSIKLDNGFLYPKDTLMKFPFQNDLEKLDEDKIEWYNDTDKAAVGDVVKTGSGLYIVLDVETDEFTGDTRYWIADKATNDIRKLHKKQSEDGVLVYTYKQSITKVGRLL